MNLTREQFNEVKRAWKAKKQLKMALIEKRKAETPLPLPKPSHKAPGPKIKKPQALSKSKIKLILHNLVKQIVLKRDKVCRICGIRSANTPYHIVRRSYLATTRDLSNVVGSCVGCNYDEHKRRDIYTKYKHPQIFGEEFYNGLWAKALEGKKWSMAELKELRESLEKELQSQTLK